MTWSCIIAHCIKHDMKQHYNALSNGKLQVTGIWTPALCQTKGFIADMHGATNRCLQEEEEEICLLPSHC